MFCALLPPDWDSVSMSITVRWGSIDSWGGIGDGSSWGNNGSGMVEGGDQWGGGFMDGKDGSLRIWGEQTS